MGDTGQAIHEAFITDDDVNIVDALFAMQRALRDLGNGNAATEMGAIEAFGKVMKEGMDDIAAALCDIARALESK